MYNIEAEGHRMLLLMSQIWQIRAYQTKQARTVDHRIFCLKIFETKDSRDKARLKLNEIVNKSVEVSEEVSRENVIVSASTEVANPSKSCSGNMVPVISGNI